MSVDVSLCPQSGQVSFSDISLSPFCAARKKRPGCRPTPAHARRMTVSVSEPGHRVNYGAVGYPTALDRVAVGGVSVLSDPSTNRMRTLPSGETCTASHVG